MTDIVSQDELFEILCLDREDPDDASILESDEIQVCAGSWKRLDEKTWRFIPDEDFSA